VLNTQLYKDCTACPELQAAQEAWLDGQLDAASLAGVRHLVVFSHVMPFIDDPDEGSGYFNLAREVRGPLLEKLHKAGATKWFCGHYHRNAGGCFRSTLEVVVSGAVGANITHDPAGDRVGLTGMDGVTIGPDTSGLRVVHVGEGEITHEWKLLKDLIPEVDDSAVGVRTPRQTARRSAGGKDSSRI
jgi:hypothetical protein